MKTYFALAACLSLAPSLLFAGGPPKSVTTAYALLARHGEVPDVLRQRRGIWLIEKGGEMAALREPTVDPANGYIGIALRGGGCDESVTEVAIFAARDGRRFAAVGEVERCIDNDHASAKFIAIDGAVPLDVTEKAGAYGTLTMLDFLDEDYLKDVDARDEAERLAYVGLVVYGIPRFGTTIRVGLHLPGSPLTGYPESEYLQARRLVEAHRKYGEIELLWSAREARFTMGRKLPK